MAYKPRLKRTARAEHVITQILVQINAPNAPHQDFLYCALECHGNSCLLC